MVLLSESCIARFLVIKSGKEGFITRHYRHIVILIVVTRGNPHKMVTLLECMHNTSLQCTAIFTKQKMSYNLDSLYILLSYFARRVKNNARTRRVVDPNQLSRRGTLPPTPGAETGFPFPLILSVRI